MCLIFYTVYHHVFPEKVEGPSEWEEVLKLGICVCLLCARQSDTCFMYINRGFGRVQWEMVAA